MNEGEVTPGISTQEYQSRRSRLAAALPAGSLALFPSAPLAYQSHDVPFPLHQDTDLSYLCGLLEPSSLLAVAKPHHGGEAEWTLFVRPACAKEALWDGPRAGVDGAKKHFLPEGSTHALNDAPSVLHKQIFSASHGVRRLLYSATANPVRAWPMSERRACRLLTPRLSASESSAP